jgi:transposase
LELTAGNISDFGGARRLVEKLPQARELLADRGYDADWFRDTLKTMGITPCIPPKKNRTIQYFYDKVLYRQRHKIENMFAKLKDWRRIAMRYDRCAHTFQAAITLAFIVIWWI